MATSALADSPLIGVGDIEESKHDRNLRHLSLCFGQPASLSHRPDRILSHCIVQSLVCHGTSSSAFNVIVPASAMGVCLVPVKDDREPFEERLNGWMGCGKEEG